ncbi:hypothetical protein C4578_00195 [Candidatus Microgenomates bacterium]|jgi:hypothetical protein|nr:MAG: hypothetical protein C4578_00195 [Candidatus Microgenomates bacterium]
MVQKINKTFLAAGPTGKPLGSFEGIGPFGTGTSDWSETCGEAGQAGCLFAQILSLILGVVTIIAFIWFIISVFTAAFGFLASGGDKVKTQNAQKQLTNALIGLVLIISSLFFVKLVGVVFGVDVLSINDLLNAL